MPVTSDPHNLERFVQAQAMDYDRALAELKAGKKRTHWMWYIFPQIAGLGRSARSERFGLKSLAEARAYLGHPVLGSRLRECATAVNNVVGLSAFEIFGSPDDLKLHSSATLFAHVSQEAPFVQLLERYFSGEADDATLRQIRIVSEPR